MTSIDLTLSSVWSSAFGLAESPLFGADDAVGDGQHRVMLDGGHGSFALSIGTRDVLDPARVASWMWSSDIPHHVGVETDRVVVSRWDKPGERRQFSMSSVQSRFDSFYRYLVKDRVEQTRSVVDHLVNQFRMVRTAVHQSGNADDKSLGVFLALLDFLSQPQDDQQTSPWDPTKTIEPDILSLFHYMRDRQLAPLVEQTSQRRLSRSDLELFSTLAIRHAGGLIFQEAHFELMRAPVPNLFGFLDAPTTKPVRRGGAHFTPPPLARSIVEQTLSRIDKLRSRTHLTVADPACGSGAFLHEAMRALQRAGFEGKLVVIGRDLSPHAIAMARFVMARAARDWEPKGGLVLDIQVADSLIEGAFPEADVIVMNPPFVAISSLDDAQRDHIDRILGPLKKGRPDLSMAFILLAVTNLKAGGALGCLFPSSLVELQSAEPWRRALLERAQLSFLAMLGDHGLFAYALVQIAAAVFSKVKPSDGDRLLTLWTADDKEATGEALRGLRSVTGKGTGAEEDHANWRLAWLPASQVRTASSWRMRSPRADRLIHEVTETTLSTVSDLFTVRQGILTGHNKAFLIDAADWSLLPKAEQKFFRPAIMNRSIRDGQVEILDYLFYPYINGQSAFATEADLVTALPRYFERTLAQHKAALSNRPSILRRANADWWDLAERRPWVDRHEPRIISKYFGAVGSFVPDYDAAVAVVQGYAWFAKEQLSTAARDLDEKSLSANLLFAYSALLNSRVFAKLLEHFATKVAGGQFNLSARYVGPVPLPDLPQICLERTRLPAVIALDALGRERQIVDQQWLDQADAAAAELYGIPLEYWN